MSYNYFRAAVGAVIFHRGRIAAFERLGAGGVWKLPQGGISPDVPAATDETPLAAVYRELEEETSLTERHLELVTEGPEWTFYELPASRQRAKQGRGQVLWWFLFSFLGEDADVDVHSVANPEFQSWRWMGWNELIAGSLEFRVPVYRRLQQWFEPLIAARS